MSRALIIVYSESDRARAAKWCRTAPQGCRIEFKEAKRSNEQNSKLWAALSDVAAQATHCGRKYPADTWKIIFLHALGREVQFVPSLDCTVPIPFGQSSSDLSREEMTALLDLIDSWGTQNGVKFHGPQEAEKVA